MTSWSGHQERTYPERVLDIRHLFGRTPRQRRDRRPSVRPRNRCSVQESRGRRRWMVGTNGFTRTRSEKRNGRYKTALPTPKIGTKQTSRTAQHPKKPHSEHFGAKLKPLPWRCQKCLLKTQCFETSLGTKNRTLKRS